MDINMAPSSKEVAAWVMDIGVVPSVNTDHGHQHGPQQQSSAAQIMDISMPCSGSWDHGQQHTLQQAGWTLTQPLASTQT